MKSLIIFSLIIVFFKSCGTKPTEINKPIFNLKLTHDECTGCLDATILNNPFAYPSDIKFFLDDTSYRDIMIEGKNPFKYEAGLFERNYKKEFYNVSGYFNRVDSNNAVGKVAVFYVLKWEKLK